MSIAGRGVRSLALPAPGLFAECGRVIRMLTLTSLTALLMPQFRLRLAICGVAPTGQTLGPPRPTAEVGLSDPG